MMIDLFPSHLKTMVKSGLRDARHVARKIGSAAKSNGDKLDRRLPPGSGQLIGKIVDYSDATLVVMETIALDILSGGTRGSAQSAGPAPLGRYLTEARGNNRSLLARDGYEAIKQIMRVKGVSTFRLHEASLEAAYNIAYMKMPGHLRESLSSNGPKSLEAVALAAACLAQGIAQALVVREPLQLLDEQRNLHQDTVPYIAAVFAMSCAAVTLHGDIEDGESIYSAVCSAVDSRYALITVELAQDAPPERLAIVFAGLLPHVP